MLRPVILFALVLTTCNTGGSASSDETSGDELEREAPLPELGRLGDVVPGRYLFPRRALGAGEGSPRRSWCASTRGPSWSPSTAGRTARSRATTPGRWPVWPRRSSTPRARW
ncbi:MAG: hypothetical protein M5U28_33565 [Sandaracinaceae bacterium]|nr:hypothetical protein [Sandaracinaceae bacterium]